MLPYAEPAFANHPPGACLDVEPETTTRTAGDPNPVVLTATLRPITAGVCGPGTVTAGATPVEISFELTGPNDPDASNSPATPDLSCFVQATTGTSCTVQYVGNNIAGTDTIRGWIDHDGLNPNQPGGAVEADTIEGRDEAAAPGTGCIIAPTPEPAPEPDCTDVVATTWNPGPAARLDCTPETDTNPIGTAHEITCTVTDSLNNPITGANVDAEATGANDPDAGDFQTPPDFSCGPTNASGQCMFTHPAAGTGAGGTTTYRAWIDIDNDNTTPEADPTEGQDSVATPGTAAEPDNTDVVAKTWSATLDCDDAEGPDTERQTNPGSSGANSNEVYTCTVASGAGTPGAVIVKGEVESGVNDPDPVDGASHGSPDYQCTTSGGTCTITVTQNENLLGTANICFWVGTEADGVSLCAAEPTDEAEANDLADRVEKTWIAGTPAAATRLDCAPETSTNPPGSSHTITCTVTNASGSPVAGAEVDAEATGANDPDGNTALTSPDFTCTTGAGGTCQFTHGPNTTNGSGLTTYRAWIDANNDNATSEADANEGRDEATVPGTGCTGSPAAEPDCTDVVEKTWESPRLDCSPETDFNPAGTAHVITCTATNGTGAPVVGINIDAEATGANDPDPAPGDSQATPDFSCGPTNASGQCSFTHGPGGTGTTAATGTTTYRAWIDIDNSNATFEADPTEGSLEASAPGTDPEPDDTDVVTKSWAGAPTRLRCTPETSSGSVGTAHTVTCTATDSNDNVVVGANIDAEATGANDADGDTRLTPDFTCTTAADGRCSFTHGPGGAGSPGTTTYRAWIDADGSNTTSEADATEGQDSAATPGATAEPDATDVVTRTWTAVRLDCSPETASNPVGTSHTVTCTATTATGGPLTGVTVDVEATGANDPDANSDPTSPDFGCGPTDTNGQCTFTHGPAGSAGVTTYRAWIDGDGNNATTEADVAEGRDEATTTGSGCAGAPGEPDCTDVVEKTWTAGAAARLDCTPESVPNNVGTSHTVTCTATDSNNNVVQGANIDVEATGANDTDADTRTTPDFTCTTTAGGQCSVTHGPGGSGTTSSAGTTTYRAWIDTDNSNATDNADATETLSPDDTDGTDVVEKIWSNPGGVATRLDCTPETATNATGTSHTVTCTATDAAANLIAGASVDVEATGANDPDGNAVLTSPDFGCTTSANGQCSVTHGPSGTTTQGTTTYRAWIDSDGSNATTEADAAEAATPEDTDNTDVVTKTWLAGTPTRLDCVPETATNAIGTSQVDTCTATESNSNVIAGTNVDVEATGANDTDGDTQTTPDHTCSTGTDGRCSFTHGPTGTTGAGTTTYRAWIDADGSNTTSEADNTEAQDSGVTPGANAESDGTDVVTKTWLAGAPRLDCTPETATGPTGTAHTVSCSVTDGSTPVNGVNVDIEATGANDADGDTRTSPDFTCTTTTGGSCSFTHTGTAVGTTVYRAWIDTDGSNATDNADSTEGREEAATPGATAEPDATDVTEKTWTVPSTATTSPPPSTVGPRSRTINLESSVNAVSPNSTFTLSGNIVTSDAVCYSGQIVTIIRTPIGGNTNETAGTLASAADGTFTGQFPGKSGVYTARLDETEACSAATSSSVTVKQKVTLTLSASRTRVPKGTRVRFPVRLTPCPGHGGTTVALFKATGSGGFSQTGSKTLSSSCTVTFRKRIRRTTTFQARWGGDADHAAGRSNRKRVRVRSSTSTTSGGGGGGF